jgi:hypothetical protein
MILPDIGAVVDRLIGDRWEWDWVALKRIDGPRDITGHITHFETGVAVWGRRGERVDRRRDQWRPRHG